MKPLKLFLKTIATTILIISCNPIWTRPTTNAVMHTQGKVSVCVNVSERTREKVVEAINSWNESLKNWRGVIPIVSDYNTCDYYINEADPPEDMKQTILARTSSLGGKYITMFKGRYEADPLGVTLHELGHAFGARHMENTLMAPHITYNYYKCPDAATVAQVAIWNDVDPGIMSWCDSSNYVNNDSILSVRIEPTIFKNDEDLIECESKENR